MKKLTFEQAVKNINKQWALTPTQRMKAEDEERLIRSVMQSFQEQCGSVPAFYVDYSFNGILVILGEEDNGW
jgi:hypothetical protein